MTDGHSGAERTHQIGSGASRVLRAWRTLPHERRLAGYAATGLFLTMFLPWYQRNFFTVIGGKLQPAADSQTAWAAFSWVEAAVLLVAGAVLALLFNRAEGRAFHVPGGDGGVITAAGLWTGLLIVWRIFDKQGASSRGQYATTYGIEWGIFIALAVAAFLFYAGNRIRAAHRPEPPLPGDERQAAARQPARRPPAPSPPARAPRPVPADREPPTAPIGGAPPPRRVPGPRRAPTRSSAPSWESAPARDHESAPTPGGENPPARVEEGAPRRPPRPRRPLPPDERLTIPLEERGEE
jgi:hypothetical protein